MADPTSSQKLDTPIYLKLTEQGAYEVAQILERYVAPGWTKMSLGFALRNLGHLPNHEGGINHWWRIVDHGDAGGTAWYLDAPGGETVNDLESPG